MQVKLWIVSKETVSEELNSVETFDLFVRIQKQNQVSEELNSVETHHKVSSEVALSRGFRRT